MYKYKNLIIIYSTYQIFFLVQLIKFFNKLPNLKNKYAFFF